MQNHEIEPALRNTPPRQVARRAGRGQRGGWGVLLAMLLLCLYLVGFTALRAYVLLRGHNAQGTITNSYPEYGKYGSEIGTRLVYNYMVNGVQYTHSTLVDSDSDADISSVSGSTVQVLYAPFAPGYGATLLSAVHAGWADIGWSAFAALVLASLTGLAAYVVLVVPRRLLLLVQNGNTTVGRITDMTKRSGSRSSSYALLYDYQAQPQGNAAGTMQADLQPQGAILKGRQLVMSADFKQVAIGDQLTVLYDPRRPSRSLLYRFAEYEAI